MLTNRGNRRIALVAALAAVATSAGCAQLMPQSQQQPAPTVTVTQPAPEQPATSEQESSAQTSEDSGDTVGDATATRTEEPEAEDGLACGARGLRMQLYPIGPSADTWTNLQVTNVTEQMCQVRGYGGLQLLDYQGNALTTEINRTQANPPTLTLQPGESAAMRLDWDVQQSPCVDSTKLQFTPPGDNHTITAEWYGAVCRNGLFDAEAFRKVDNGG